MPQEILGETAVKGKLRKLCKDNNILLNHYPQNGMGVAGFADYIAFFPCGKTVLIECKGTGKKLSPNQVAFKDLVEKRKVAYLIYRATPEDNKQILDFITAEQTNVRINSEDSTPLILRT